MIIKDPAPELSRIRFTVSYEGTNYCGWQKQKRKDQLSVAQVLEKTLGRIFNEEISLFASGRTDAGVHALNQVCHFDTRRKIDPARKWDFIWAMNTHLPPSIVIKKAWLAPPEFHATLSATHKTYRYLILNRPRPSALLARHADWQRLPLDLKHLQESSEFIKGFHDFKSFQTAGTPVKTTVRTIHQAQWSQRRPDLLQFDITGSGFLKQMVRNIVGTQIHIQRKGLEPREIQRILQAQDRIQAGPPASPQGLYLMRVYYPQELDIRCREL